MSPHQQLARTLTLSAHSAQLPDGSHQPAPLSPRSADQHQQSTNALIHTHLSLHPESFPSRRLHRGSQKQRGGSPRGVFGSDQVPMHKAVGEGSIISLQRKSAPSAAGLAAQEKRLAIEMIKNKSAAAPAGSTRPSREKPPSISERTNFKTASAEVPTS